MDMYKPVCKYFLLMLLAILLPQTAVAVEVVDSGDSAWVMTSTALVLFMTLPGLALFYGGLVRVRNVLSILMQCFAIACVGSLVWVVVGYSLAFGDGGDYVRDLLGLISSRVVGADHHHCCLWSDSFQVAIV